MRSVDDWVARLSTQLQAQRVHAAEYDDYYTGERRLRVIEDEYREVFGILPEARDLLRLRPPDTNVAAVGVDALVERLELESWSSLPGQTDKAAEKAASSIAVGMDLDVVSAMAHREAFVKARSFLLVGDGPDGAVISAEDASQVAVARSPEPPYDVEAGLKLYADPWGGPDRGILWLPGRRIPLSQTSLVLVGRDLASSPWRAEREVALPGALANAVPLAEVSYRSRLIAEPVSYIKQVASLADSYALLMAYLVIAARYGAIPVKTMTGITLPRGVDGKPLPFERTGADRALASENPAAKFGQLDAGQLAGFIGAIDMLLSSIVSMTRVPQHYYGQGGKSGISGEQLKTSETGLVRRAADVQKYLQAPWRRAMSWAVSLELGRDARVVPRWANTETRVEAQLADAFQKYVASGVPMQAALEHLGFPAETVSRALELRDSEQARSQMILAATQAHTGQGGGSTVPLQVA